jgi:hypothetical protein
MRSIMLALVLAAPVSAVAATPNYTNPMTTAHRVKPEEVRLTFVNHTPSEREVRIGDQQYRIRNNSEFHVLVIVGSVVSVYSDQDSKINGQQIIQVSAKDANSAVFLK